MTIGIVSVVPLHYYKLSKFLSKYLACNCHTELCNEKKMIKTNAVCVVVIDVYVYVFCFFLFLTQIREPNKWKICSLFKVIIRDYTGKRKRKKEIITTSNHMSPSYAF